MLFGHGVMGRAGGERPCCTAATCLHSASFPESNDCQTVPRSDSTTPKIPSRCKDHPRECHTLCTHAPTILSSGRRHVVVLSAHMFRKKNKKRWVMFQGSKWKERQASVWLHRNRGSPPQIDEPSNCREGISAYVFRSSYCVLSLPFSIFPPHLLSEK